MQQHRIRASFAVTSIALVIGLSGCGSADAEGPPAKAPAAAAAPVPAAPPGHLARVTVDRVLVEQGPPWLLRRVMRNAVILDSGKFGGWQITGLPEEWSDIDLQPGDVVTTVNGKELESPDGAWEAWKSVAKARVLKISLKRKGAVRELSIPIDGEPDAAVARALEAPPSRGRPPEPRGVQQIGAGEPPPEAEYESY